MDVEKLMVVALAGWINQQQEDVIDYLREEKGRCTAARHLSTGALFQHEISAV